LVKKYGVENVFQSDTIKAQIETTFKNRYGVRNAQQVKEIRNRTRISNIEKYGQDGWNPEQTKKTMQEKYGVDYPLQSPAIREKIRLTSQARYGTDSPMQNAEIFERCQRAQEKARYRFKQVELPSGDVRWAQGYEPQVINYLLQSDISETDLKTDRTDIPVIRYFFENRERIYFPDIFIPSKNMLIEVKSGYTWVKDILKNLAKHDAAKNAGFRHLIVIWDDNKNNIKELIN
jgi:hypothetical protein